MLAYLSLIFSTLVNFFNFLASSISNFFTALKELLLNILQSFFNFFVDFFYFLKDYLYYYWADIVVSVFDLCATCGIRYTLFSIVDGINSFKSLDFGWLSSCLAYLADVFALNMGFKLIVCAFLLRFAIRRLPVVG